MIKIFGASDDIVTYEQDGETDEIGCYDKGVRFVIGHPEAAPGRDAAGVIVRMRYAPDGFEGVWTAEIGPIDEDIEIPWPVTVTLGGRGYSALVTIDCPKDTPLTWDGKDEDEQD